jgi:ubiquinone/menaquinone biosynthesis C-methylase UbiE
MVIDHYALLPAQQLGKVRSMHTHRPYIPALNREWLTPLYDPLLRWLFHERSFKQQLIEQAIIQTGDRVLDLGCGTGTLMLMLKQRHPHARVVGVDIDERILGIARRKALRGQVDLHFARGSAVELPYADGSFDRVLSSLMFHHLTAAQKQHALGEAFRVLRPGGEAHIVDFGKPHTRVAQAIAVVARHFEAVSDNVRGLLPIMLRQAGFVQVEEGWQRMTLLGTLTFISARKPGEPHEGVTTQPSSEIGKLGTVL